ncbi:hypothetical protein N8000_05345 [Rhodospirillales bacterium]|nr:hypothetical protein [Rhodospirillales bacterium]
MMNRWKILEDNHEDDAHEIIRELNARTGWNKHAQKLQAELGELLKRKGYMRFWSTSGCYLVSKIGESFLYDVPLYKRGHLQDFVGKRIRVVCISSGLRFDREYMVGEIGRTPAEKVVSRISEEYSFPNIGEHEVLYSSPRFRLLKPSRNTRVASSLAPSGFINFDDCDAALIDGVKGIPIAKLRYLDNGFMEGTLLHYSYWRRFSSVQDAISHLSFSSDKLHKPLNC